MSSEPTPSSAHGPHAGFASEERKAAALAFLSAHASYGFLGNFLKSCEVLQSPHAPAVLVIGGESKTTITIPAALDRYTDAPVGAANPLSAAIVDEAGRFLIRQLTRSSRPLAEASGNLEIAPAKTTNASEGEIGQRLAESLASPPIELGAAAPKTEPSEFIGENELRGVLAKEGLDDIASKLFDRRSAAASPSSAPSAPSV